VPQWSKEPRYSATRVSLHLLQVPVAEALAALTAQSHVRFDLSPPDLLTRVNGLKASITLDADSMSLTEAILRLCAQSNLAILPEEPSGGSRQIAPYDGSPRILLSRAGADRMVGIWTESGAFGFDLTRIDQSGPLRPDAATADNVALTINLHAEPKVWVLGAPVTNQLAVTEMIDENGNSLISAPVSVSNAGLWRRNLNVRLPADHGRWIKRLVADCVFTVGTRTDAISVPDIEAVSGSTLRTDAIAATFQSVIRPTEPAQVNTQMSIVVAYSPRDASSIDWATIAPLLRRGRVWIDGWGTPSQIQSQADNKAKPPLMRVTYVWNNMQHGAPGGLRIELPVVVEKLHFPMEFRDVPLP
jgi:hypothetical protein